MFQGIRKTLNIEPILVQSLASVFQPGFCGTLGFREWLPGVPPKQTEFARVEICNHSFMRL